MRWAAEVFLRDVETNMVVDAEGNEIEGEPIDTRLVCNLRTSGYETWATAAQLGVKPELEIETRTLNYSGQTQLVYQGREYDLSYTKERGDFITLVYVTHARNDNG